MGYVVEMHESAVTALHAFNERPHDFDLLITDLTMPGMTGMELAQQALKVRPAIPILLMSGYAATLTPERLRADGIRGFLPKPHSVRSLAIAVGQTLGNAPST